MDGDTGGDSKLVERVGSAILSKVSLIVASVMATLVCTLLAILGSFTYKTLQTQREADIVSLTNQNAALGVRIDGLAQSIGAYHADLREMRSEVEKRGSRIATLEAEHRSIGSSLSRMETELQNLRNEVAALRAALSRPRSELRLPLPAPPAEDQAQIRIPMLWHF